MVSENVACGFAYQAAQRRYTCPVADGGIDENRVTAVGHGPTRPVGPNDSAEARLRNRRVSVMILSNLLEERTEVPVEVP